MTYIDWHQKEFVGIDGIRAVGWHRHVWSNRTRSCEDHRLPLRSFNPARIEEFILQGFKELNVWLKEDLHEHGKQLSIA